MVDGTVFDVKPTLHSNNLPHDVYRAIRSDETYTCDVVGSTCMEKDVLLKDVMLPKLNAGDFIKFKGVGAYTICLTPTFINFLAPTLMRADGTFVQVRRRQTVEDIISIYNF
jgi:diaminopimelate decarboxylase